VRSPQEIGKKDRLAASAATRFKIQGRRSAMFRQRSGQRQPARRDGRDRFVTAHGQLPKMARRPVRAVSTRWYRCDLSFTAGEERMAGRRSTAASARPTLERPRRPNSTRSWSGQSALPTSHSGDALEGSVSSNDWSQCRAKESSPESCRTNPSTALFRAACARRARFQSVPKSEARRRLRCQDT
jgi:hypothetical protein